MFTALFLLIVLIFFSCTRSLSDNEELAKVDIKNKGYELIESKGEIDKYRLDKSKILGGAETTPYQQIWGVQSISPDEYFDKNIITYEFIVKNHPLQKVDSNAKNGVKLYYMFADGEIIGGYSYPNENVYGAVSSLDGKSLEEVTGLTFSKWSEEWVYKYSQQIRKNIKINSKEDIKYIHFYTCHYQHQSKTEPK